jgi:hypothetical protein
MLELHVFYRLPTDIRTEGTIVDGVDMDATEQGLSDQDGNGE